MDGVAGHATYTLDRDLAQEEESLELLGIDHPIISRLIDRSRNATPDGLGAVAAIDVERRGVLTLWLVQAHGKAADTATHIVPIAIDDEGKRLSAIEKQYDACFVTPSGEVQFDTAQRQALLHEHIEPKLQRELGHRGIAGPEGGYSSELLTWVELR